MAETVVCRLPDWARHLWEDRRYTVPYGGRGSAKSWTVARALLLQGSEEPHRILCGREVQRSIKDSVHRLLCDQAINLGLERFYQVTDNEIRGRNGTLFVFTGLSSHTVESVKSYEGITRLWIEEGQTLSKRSLDVIIPTIRTENSRIWVTMNPFLDTDPAAQRFLIDPGPDCLPIRVNYTENPYFPLVLDKERREHLRRDPGTYGNVWLGEFAPAVPGAIFYDEMAQLERQNRLRPVPIDPLLRCHTVWDLGLADNTAVAVVQVAGNAIYVVHGLVDNNRRMSSYLEELELWKRDHPGVVWGEDFLPHDGWHRDYTSGQSPSDIIHRMKGKMPRKVPETTVEQGIKALREAFPRFYISDRLRKSQRHGKAAIVDSLKRYAWDIPASGDIESRRPKHDEHSHVGDLFRYIALSVPHMSNESWSGDLDYSYHDRGVI